MDKSNLTQFGRALSQLGIEQIPSYFLQARGRSERIFATHQGRLPKELALHGITDMESANRYLREEYLPAFNREFTHPAQEEGTVFVPYAGLNLKDVLCEQPEWWVMIISCLSRVGDSKFPLIRNAFIM